MDMIAFMMVPDKVKEKIQTHHFFLLFLTLLPFPLNHSLNIPQWQSKNTRASTWNWTLLTWTWAMKRTNRPWCFHARVGRLMKNQEMLNWDPNLTCPFRAGPETPAVATAANISIANLCRRVSLSVLSVTSLTSAHCLFTHWVETHAQSHLVSPCVHFTVC